MTWASRQRDGQRRNCTCRVPVPSWNNYRTLNQSSVVALYTHHVTPGPTSKTHKRNPERKLGERHQTKCAFTLSTTSTLAHTRTNVSVVSALDSSSSRRWILALGDSSTARLQPTKPLLQGCGSCCGVVGESGAMVKCTPVPCPDWRMNATSVAAKAAASWTNIHWNKHLKTRYPVN